MSPEFADVEHQWQRRLGRLRDLVRQETVTRQLTEHLSTPVRVLDVGCGQGTQAIRLARSGHQVTGLDASADLLARLRHDLAREPEPVRRRVRTVHATVDDATTALPSARFDAVLCHGVLMYFPDPEPVLATLAAMTAPGGLVSLLVRNGGALAMRPALLGDWGAAVDAFDATTYPNRMGVEARADRLGDLTAALARRGLTLRQWYGVKVFTDTAPDDATPPDGDELAALLDCEERAGRTDPYRGVASLLHLIAHRA